MKILITGGCGFVGSNLAIYLKKKYRNITIETLDNLSRNGSFLNLKRLKKHNIKNYAFNIENYNKIKKMPKYSFIIDCCAEAAVEVSKTETDKETDASLDPVIGLGGLPVNIGGDSIQFGIGSDSSFKGDSKSNQSNSLVGDISVNVMRVLPNGNLVIRGEKWLTLNTGEEFIRLEGLVRPQDVNADNTVESNRIANARIQYSGKGQTQEAQSPGWLTRFFSSSLFPF